MHIELGNKIYVLHWRDGKAYVGYVDVVSSASRGDMALSAQLFTESYSLEVSNEVKFDEPILRNHFRYVKSEMRNICEVMDVGDLGELTCNVSVLYPMNTCRANIVGGAVGLLIVQEVYLSIVATAKDQHVLDVTWVPGESKTVTIGEYRECD